MLFLCEKIQCSLWYILAKQTIQDQRITTLFRGMQSKAHGEAHQQITIGSLNIQNILANEVYLRAVLSQCDLLCIQEHWIFSHRKSIFQEIITSHEVEAKSVDDENPLFDPFASMFCILRDPIVICWCASPWALLCIPLKRVVILWSWIVCLAKMYHSCL
jgi:hypothetical protein